MTAPLVGHVVQTGRMPDDQDARVAVYIDFDNIVISRYDQLHGSGRFHKDRARKHVPTKAVSQVGTRIEEATVDVGAILDFASSYGTIVMTRAYADWSVPVNAGYQKQLIDRAVDLVQLFPVTAGMKNGADIRMAVDVVEDLFRLPDLTHVVIVAGDSDYIPVAQRSKRLGRYVVGIGVAGGTSRSLAAACDEFADYDALPGITPAAPSASTSRKVEKAESPQRVSEKDAGADAATDAQEAATRLLTRALQIGHRKDDDDWLHSSVVKAQMRRMDPSFSEKALGHRSFTDFVKSRSSIAEMREEGQARLIRLNSALLDR